MIKNSAFLFIFANMAYYFKIIVLYLVFVSITFASDSIKTKERLLFQPLFANPLESRVGTFYQFDINKLRLDIGASVDLIRTQISVNEELTFGSDFMNYTRLRHDGRLKFPVETADYYFGINSAYKLNYNDTPISLRLRIAHISSHVIDGLADSITLTKEPFVYSREFFDFVAAINLKNFRLYTGTTVIFSTLPKNILRFNPQLGFEYKYNLGNKYELIAGYDFKLVGYDATLFGQNSLQLGVLKLMSNNNGIFSGLYYYSGKSIHGMFYKDYDQYLGAGFQLYFY